MTMIPLVVVTPTLPQRINALLKLGFKMVSCSQKTSRLFRPNWHRPLITCLVALVIGIGGLRDLPTVYAQTAVSKSGGAEQSAGLQFQKDAAEDWWIERGHIAHTENPDVTIQGPIVVRVVGQPTFFFQIVEIEPPKFERSIPYVIVINEENAFRTLTSFDLLPQAMSLTTFGCLLGTKVGHVSFKYEVDWFKWTLEKDAVKEAMKIYITEEFLKDDSNTDPDEFGQLDLRNGRCFEVTFDHTTNTTGIRQRQIAPPASDQIVKFEQAHSPRDQAQVLLDWWAEASQKK